MAVQYTASLHSILIKVDLSALTPQEINHLHEDLIKIVTREHDHAFLGAVQCIAAIADGLGTQLGSKERLKYCALILDRMTFKKNLVDQCALAISCLLDKFLSMVRPLLHRLSSRTIQIAELTLSLVFKKKVGSILGVQFLVFDTVYFVYLQLCFLLFRIHVAC